jgi:hypothetical protein
MSATWYIKRAPKNQGPFTLDQLQALAASGKLAPTDRIGCKGMEKWAKAGSVAGIFPNQTEEVVAEAVAEEEAIEAIAVELDRPAPAKTSAAPWILAGVVGGGVLLLGCSGLLCAGLAVFIGQSDDGDSATNFDSTGAFAASDFTGQPLVSETQPAPFTEPAAWQPAPEVAPVTPAAPVEPAAPAISADATAAIAKADGGDRESMYEMSFRYQEGNGVPADEGTSIGWLTKAAEAGHPDAMNDLSYRYAKGEGVAENGEWAAYWFGKGAEAGSGMAMFNFAVCHAQGVGVPQNDFAARIWIMKSAESGYEPAQNAVKQMQAELVANAFGAVLEGMFGGGDDGGGDTSAEDADREYWNARRREKDYWEDRASRAAASGDQMDYDYSKRMAPP